MSRNIYRDVGCSQEDHLPNCGHFGESGAYLSPHAKYCKSDKFEPCTCNPKAREEREAREWRVTQWHVPSAAKIAPSQLHKYLALTTDQLDSMLAAFVRQRRQFSVVPFGPWFTVKISIDGNEFFSKDKFESQVLAEEKIKELRTREQFDGSTV